MNSFLLGCPCGHKIKVNTNEHRKEVRCTNCKRYIKVPNLENISPKFITTESLSSNKQDQTIGKILAKRFRIESHIADGAMGKVYKATDLILKKSVAVKILKLDSFPHEMRERYEKRFLTEARIGLELLHSGIVPVRSVHRLKRGTIFFVMDLCPGQSLRNILMQKKKLPIEEAIEITKQLLIALQVAHEKGIAHRDIKPGNIMVEHTSEGIKVRVLDFGVAKVFSEMSGLEQQTLTKTGYIIGTTRYMAPEQILSKNVGGHTDIYAAGALLYHMISGTTPFSGTRQNILKSTLRTKPMPLSQICLPPTIISKILDAIVIKSLEKDPRNRFRNAQEFASALDYNKKGKLWQYSIITETFLYNIRSKMDQKVSLLVAAALFILAITFICTNFIFPFFEHKKYLQQAQQLWLEKKYEEAFISIGNAQKAGISLEQKILKQQILFSNIIYSLNKKDYKSVEYYLEILFTEDSESKIAKTLKTCIEQEKNLYVLEELIAKKSLEEAKLFLESLKDEDTQMYAERKLWLEKNGKNN